MCHGIHPTLMQSNYQQFKNATFHHILQSIAELNTRIHQNKLIKKNIKINTDLAYIYKIQNAKQKNNNREDEKRTILVGDLRDARPISIKH